MEMACHTHRRQSNARNDRGWASMAKRTGGNWSRSKIKGGRQLGSDVCK